MTNARFLRTCSTTPLYNTKLVVSETGVPADTFRAWERRYGLPRPERSGGGQRLYSERDIALIRWLRDRTGEGLTISQAIALLETDADGASANDQPRSFDALRSELGQALLRFDASSADAILSEAFALYSLDAVCVNIVQPVLVDVGELWHAGKASVAQEHFASQFLRRKLLALLNIYDIPEGRATIVAACAPGEQHDLGLMLLALLLVRRQFKVIFLGADVPSDALLQAIEQVRPQIVCISATTPTTADHALHLAHTIGQRKAPPLVFIGGQGTTDQIDGDHTIQLLPGSGVAAADQISAAVLRKRVAGPAAE